MGSRGSLSPSHPALPVLIKTQYSGKYNTEDKKEDQPGQEAQSRLTYTGVQMCPVDGHLILIS